MIKERAAAAAAAEELAFLNADFEISDSDDERSTVSSRAAAYIKYLFDLSSFA